MRVIDKAEVRQRLTFERCIPLMRTAMIALSAGETRQVLRSIVPLGEGRLFGVMPGALGCEAVFGAKLVSVFAGGAANGAPSHQGVVVLFDGASGAPVCVADAGEITAIRTAAASAAATDALARPDAAHLAILGCGEQAMAHARAIADIRALSAISIWGRRPDRATALAKSIEAVLGISARACESARVAVREAEIVCTVTAASEPVLLGCWLGPGTHVNLVGSSYAGPVEVDEDLVACARFIADSRAGVLAQGAEFLNAKASGRISDDHVVGEIGQVFSSEIDGRQSRDQLTVYKSLGHIVQDLAAVRALVVPI